MVLTLINTPHFLDPQTEQGLRAQVWGLHADPLVSQVSALGRRRPALHRVDPEQDSKACLAPQPQSDLSFEFNMFDMLTAEPLFLLQNTAFLHFARLGKYQPCFPSSSGPRP